MQRGFRAALCAGVLLATSAARLHADPPPTYSIQAHVIAAGTSARGKSACFRMDATIGEPVAGFSSSTDYTLSGGFRALVPTAGDDLFFDGFESCTP